MKRLAFVAIALSVACGNGSTSAPEADPATLADPSKVALRILNLLDGERPAENGARVQAHEWEAAS